MQVILCENVENLGEMGQTVKVAPGYARNFLLPRNMAVQADSGNAKQIEHELKIIKKREEKWRATQQDAAKKLEGVTVEIKMRSGEGDKLFGSVTNAMIADQLAAMGHEISRKAIEMPEPIKSLGIFTVKIKLASGIFAEIKVWVSSENEVPVSIEEEVTEEPTES